MEKNKKLVGNVNSGYILMDAEEIAKVEAIGHVLGGYLGIRSSSENDIPYHRNCGVRNTGNTLQITKVVFNDPATIVYWSDGSKTVVKAIDEDFDREKGLSMAITKKVYGNTGNYYNIIKKWCEGNGDDNGQK